VKTVDRLPQLFAVNTLAPYILTALITMPKRLVYLSSEMHYGAASHLDDMLWERRFGQFGRSWVDARRCADPDVAPKKIGYLLIDELVGVARTFRRSKRRHRCAFAQCQRSFSS
jgi:hypothetical protein